MSTSRLVIKTNNVPRFTLDPDEVTKAERAELDYLDWDKLDSGEDSCTLVRYKNWVYDLSEFDSLGDRYQLYRENLPELKEWHAIQSDTFFSGVLVRWVSDNCESVIMGRYYC